HVVRRSAASPQQRSRDSRDPAFPSPPPIRQALLHRPRHFSGIELIGIERPAPLHKLLVLFMLRVGQSFKVLVEAPDPADILGRAGSLSFEAQRVLLTGLRLWAAFEQDLMFPAIAEVVLVDEAESLAGLRQ